MNLSRLSVWVLTKILSQSLKRNSNDRLKRYGSPYGGWTICQCEDHFSDQGIFISAGVGEDISFDTELLRDSSLLAVLVDPTDRAETHVKKYLSSSDQLMKPIYSDTGNQPIASYFSTKDIKNRMKMIKKALWIDNNGIDLYPPLTPSHVSYRLATTAGKKKSARRFPSIDITTLVAQMAIDANFSCEPIVVVLKMDIEGSEYSVIVNLTKNVIRPKQLLVELDFIREKNPYLQSLRLYSILRIIKRHQYRLAHIEKLNCLFLDSSTSS